MSRARRSAIMSAVRNKNTTPELLVRRAAHRLGLRFRLHLGRLPGRPDLVFPKWKTVVFVNGCFWHGHVGCRRASLPKSRIGFWRRKRQENLRRDAANYSRLAELGWQTVVVWQCELGRPGTIERAISLLRARLPFLSRRPYSHSAGKS
jgi:DNA mismatch endonuclease (patch repair protein)